MYKRVFGLVIDFGTSQSPKSTRPLTTYWCPSRPGHQALRNNFASSLLLRTWLPMTGRRVRRPTLFSLWRKARRENSAASRLLGSTSLRFALHGWQRWMVTILSLSLLALIGTGIYLEIRPLNPNRNTQNRWKAVVGANLLLFVGAQVGLLVLGMHDAMAEAAAVNAGGAREISVGLGLSLIGIGIPTALATIGAGIAVGPVGAASLAVISEKPELFGRTLIYLGLAEGIAIYGLVVTIKIG